MSSREQTLADALRRAWDVARAALTEEAAGRACFIGLRDALRRIAEQAESLHPEPGEGDAEAA